MSRRNNSLIREIMLSEEFLRQPPVLIDVGASGGIHAAWRGLAPYSICIAFDPDVRDFREGDASRGFRECHTVRAIVGEQDAPSQTVYLTKSPYCSSTLPPRPDGVAGYAHASLFDVVGTTAARSVRLETVLAERGLDYVDWLKTDSQGVDCRVVNSLTADQRSRLLVVELEPGIVDGYLGEDKLHHVLAAFDFRDFWCSSLVAKGPVRGSASVLRKHLSDAAVVALPVTEKTCGGWAEIEYINTFTSPGLHTQRDLLLGWVIASSLGHHAFALELADRGQTLFSGDARFGRLVAASIRGIRWRSNVGLVRRAVAKAGRLLAGKR
jgi:FkbM family methyltransferase